MYLYLFLYLFMIMENNGVYLQVIYKFEKLDLEKQ